VEEYWGTCEANRHFGIYYQAPGNKQNAGDTVLSAWRNAQSFFTTTSPTFDANASTEIFREVNRLLNEEALQALSKLAPASDGGGSYLDEAAVDELNGEEDFYGAQYSRLVSIKKNYDPCGVSNAMTAIGGDEWEIRGPELCVTAQNGRLCRVYRRFMARS
jgi:hypothetical protein